MCVCVGGGGLQCPANVAPDTQPTPMLLCVLQMPLRRLYTAKWRGTPAFVKVLPAGRAAEREVAALEKLQPRPECRVVPLLHVARVKLVLPRHMKRRSPHVALVTELAPHSLFAGVRDAMSEVVELLQVCVVELQYCTLVAVRVRGRELPWWRWLRRVTRYCACVALPSRRRGEHRRWTHCTKRGSCTAT